MGEVGFDERKLVCDDGGAVFLRQEWGDTRLYLGVTVKAEGAYDPDVIIELSPQDIRLLLEAVGTFARPFCQACGILVEDGVSLCADCDEDDE